VLQAVYLKVLEGEARFENKVMGLEREVKRTQLSLLIRTKNLLTEAQQAKLAELHRVK